MLLMHVPMKDFTVVVEMKDLLLLILLCLVSDLSDSVFQLLIVHIHTPSWQLTLF